MTASSDDLIVIARAVRTRGLKGEFVAELLTDFPERFEDVKTWWSFLPTVSESWQLEDYWFQNDRVILKLTSYDDSRAQSSSLVLTLPCPKASGFRSRMTSFTTGNSKAVRSKSATRASARFVQ